jgi:hypothetical protein
MSDLALAARTHSPVRWFERGVYPECSCGFAPHDNALLYRHWAEFGISWYHDTAAGQLKWRKVS